MRPTPRTCGSQIGHRFYNLFQIPTSALRRSAMTATSSNQNRVDQNRTSQPVSVRTIDAGRPPARFARGWHCLGLAESFRDGAPHAVQAFGTKLVVFADSTGAL